MFQKPSVLEYSNITFMTEKEVLNNLVYKFEALNSVVNKMDTSIQDLQEKSHTWAIFHHHINSWNEGIRILENKLDILKRTHEEQQQQLQKLEFFITSKSLNVNVPYDSFRDEIKQFFSLEHKVNNEMLSKINNIVRHFESPTAMGNEKISHRFANIIGPKSISTSSTILCDNIIHRIDQRLNTIIQHMAQQKDLKQLNTLERRNSKNMENINQILIEQLDKQDEITVRLQKSNECCYSLSSELTTFTESSDILLKRIEKLVRNVSEKLNDFQVSNENELDKDYTSEELDVAEDNLNNNSTDTSFTTNLYYNGSSPDVGM